VLKLENLSGHNQGLFWGVRWERQAKRRIHRLRQIWSDSTSCALNVGVAIQRVFHRIAR
jgi:hypothetical protein